MCTWGCTDIVSGYTYSIERYQTNFLSEMKCQ